MVTIGSVYQRDYPTNFMRLWENVSDPAHFAFTHAGIAADRCGRRPPPGACLTFTSSQEPATTQREIWPGLLAASLAQKGLHEGGQ